MQDDKLSQCAKGRGIEGSMKKSRIQADEYHRRYFPMISRSSSAMTSCGSVVMATCNRDNRVASQDDYLLEVYFSFGMIAATFSKSSLY